MTSSLEYSKTIIHGKNLKKNNENQHFHKSRLQLPTKNIYSTLSAITVQLDNPTKLKETFETNPSLILIYKMIKYKTVVDKILNNTESKTICLLNFTNT